MTRRAIGRRALGRVAGVLGVSGVGASILGARGQASSATVAGQGGEIVGTWMISSPGPSMRLLQTYGADGTHLSVHDEHPTRSPQLGTWTQVGDRQFLMRNLSFRFDAAGRQTGSIDVRAVYTISANGETMSGRGVRLELDLQGNLLTPPIPWQSEAVRVRPVPLD